MRIRNHGPRFALLAAALFTGLAARAPRAQEDAPTEPAPSREPAVPPELPPLDAAPGTVPEPTPTPPSSGAFPLPPSPSPEPALPAPAAPAAPAAPPSSPPTVAREPPRARPSLPRREPVARHYETPPDSAATSDQPKARRQGDGWLGPLRLGLLLGGGLPNVLSVGATLKLTRFVGAGINVGFIPTIKISFYGEAKVSFQEYDAYGRVYPFGGDFFVGAGVGYANVNGSLSTTYDASAFGLGDITIPSKAKVRTLVLTPQLGVLHIFDSGLALGADLGAQIPIAPSNVEFDTQFPDLAPLTPTQERALIARYVTPNDKKVRDTLETIGRTVIPTMSVKIGFVF